MVSVKAVTEGIAMSNESSPKVSLTLPIGRVKSRYKREEQLYELIKSALQRELEEYLNSQKERIGEGFIGKVHLEITANGRLFSEELKEVLDNDGAPAPMFVASKYNVLTSPSTHALQTSIENVYWCTYTSRRTRSLN